MQSAARIKTQIIKAAHDLGFDDCKITNANPPESGAHFQRWLKSGAQGTMSYLERSQAKRLNPSRILPNIRSILTLATSYHQKEHAHDVEREGSGVIARYARFKDYHEILAKRLDKLVAILESSVHFKSQSLWYVDTGPILERDLAQRAGLGFIGKHTNLISRFLGNWFFISEILTTIPLAPDEAEKNRCGKCRRCIDVCPTQAIVRPFVLDARKCISYLTIEIKGSIPVELRSAVGDRIFGCDDCLAICPWNRFAREGNCMRQSMMQTSGEIDLETWAKIPQSDFKRRFAGTPFYRTKWKGLMRNLCVAMGNVGSRRHLPTLNRLRQSSEPLVAEHAEWAILQIVKRQSKSSM